jgi:hypothetical protein
VQLKAQLGAAKVLIERKVDESEALLQLTVQVKIIAAYKS